MSVRAGHVVRESNSHWTRTGRPKDEFATYKEAKDHAEKLLAEDLANGHLMTFPKAYECVLGGHYHVGNANPRTRRAEGSTT